MRIGVRIDQAARVKQRASGSGQQVAGSASEMTRA